LTFQTAPEVGVAVVCGVITSEEQAVTFRIIWAGEKADPGASIHFIFNPRVNSYFGDS
jgi:hypothetical protein